MTFDDVRRLAAERAQQGFDDGDMAVPSEWTEIGLDTYRSIRFLPEKALWRDGGLFRIQFFHPGLYYDRAVRINEVVDGRSRPVPYDRGRFQFDLPAPETGAPGYAGFRVHYPMRSSEVFEEFTVFLGASYFRVIGLDQTYGLSARGLAIDTANPRGEEFPRFTDFWLVRPGPEDTEMMIYALLDSAGTSGAYRFVLRPGTTTKVEVTAELHPRHAISKLGIAPLTGMYLMGEGDGRHVEDFRPEIHDIDGLMLNSSSGEWIWRPLVARGALAISSFTDGNPRGFGLVQRDRDFQSYQDLESRYHQRPSYWIQPLDPWGEGRVELVEIPSDSEINDNVIAFWVPAVPVEAGVPLSFRYMLNVYTASANWPPAGYVAATRVGPIRPPGSREDTPGRLFVIDFVGGDLADLDYGQPIQAVVTASAGVVSEAVAQRNEEAPGWRIIFTFDPQDARSADIRAFLRLRNQTLSETWNYLWMA